MYLGCMSQATRDGSASSSVSILVTDSRRAFTVRRSSMSPMYGDGYKRLFFPMQKVFFSSPPMPSTQPLNSPESIMGRGA